VTERTVAERVEGAMRKLRARSREELADRYRSGETSRAFPDEAYPAGLTAREGKCSGSSQGDSRIRRWRLSSFSVLAPSTRIYGPSTASSTCIPAPPPLVRRPSSASPDE
jgi:hypothetical protein